jgi:hypothetical protein
MRKSLFNYSFYSHPEIGKFQGVTRTPYSVVGTVSSRAPTRSSRCGRRCWRRTHLPCAAAVHAAAPLGRAGRRRACEMWPCGPPPRREIPPCGPPPPRDPTSALHLLLRAHPLLLEPARHRLPPRCPQGPAAPRGPLLRRCCSSPRRPLEPARPLESTRHRRCAPSLGREGASESATVRVDWVDLREMRPAVRIKGEKNKGRKE